MADEIVVKVEGEETGTVEAAATADVVIDKAVEIAEIITEAQAEGAEALEEVKVIKYTLDDIYGQIFSVGERIAVLTDLVEGLYEEVASLKALETAEIVVEATPEEVKEIAAVAEVVEAETPVPTEEVPTAVEPALRKSKKTKWV